MIRGLLALVLVLTGAGSTAADIPEAEQRASWAPVDPQEAWKACPKPVWPTDPAQTGRRVLILGDSLTKYAYRPLLSQLKRRGWLPTIVCWGGTQTDWGLKQARDVQRRRYIPDRVVVAFGTNDVHKNPCSGDACADQARLFGKRAERMLSFLGPQTQVWWLNIDMDAERAARALGEPWNVHFPLFNRELATTVAKHPNVTLIDWHRIVRSHSKTVRYTADGLHYAPIEQPRRSVGTMLRVRTIVEALESSSQGAARVSG